MKDLEIRVEDLEKQLGDTERLNEDPKISQQNFSVLVTCCNANVPVQNLHR